MKIKNSQVVLLANILYEMELSGTESRMRTRLWKLLFERSESNKKEMEQLIKEFQLLDKEGNPIFEKEEDIYPKVSDEFNVHYTELMSEYLNIELNEDNKKMLTTVANIFLKQKLSVSKDFAIVYDDICEEFENVLAYYNKSNNKNNRNYKKYNNRK